MADSNTGTQTVVVLKEYAPRTGLPDPDKQFEVRRGVRIPTADELREGECLVKNLYLSMDPTMRGWMTDIKGSYLPPIQLGKVMRGGSVGQILASKSKRFKPGDFVNCTPDAVGWAQYGIAKDVLLVPVKPRESIPIRAFTGALGGTGLTAYFGLMHLGQPKKGDTVIVSAAAGAVGSVACQLAKRVCGCRVIGIAGGSKKCAWLKDNIGVDAAVDYKSKDFASELRKAVGSRGADVVFDNVGGAILDAMLRHLNKGARVVLCGAVSAMNEGPQPIANLMSLIVKSATMCGFTLFDFQDKYDEAFDNLSQYILEGKLVYVEDMVSGVENAPRALLKLFGADGGNFGKLLVDLHPASSKL